MKKFSTLLISAILIAATFVACNRNNDDEYTPYTPAPTVSVTSVSLSPASATLVVGDEVTLIATILPEEASNQNVTWTSSNDAVATVENGVVTAVFGGGVAKITATTEDGNHTDYFTVAVVVARQGCNTNEPNWGESLGTISWGTIGNTNIETGTTEITGTDGRPNQVWSGAVFASACAEKTTFDGGSAGDFNADCRRAYTELTGHFFSWCAVVRFADQLCPYPWRVPTMEDFADLHQNLGFTLPINTGGSVAHGDAGDFVPTEGTGTNPQVGGTWGGARFTGAAATPTLAGSYYWSSSELSATNARNLSLNATSVWPQGGNGKTHGSAVRCVR